MVLCFHPYRRTTEFWMSPELSEKTGSTSWRSHLSDTTNTIRLWTKSLKFLWRSQKIQTLQRRLRIQRKLQIPPCKGLQFCCGINGSEVQRHSVGRLISSCRALAPVCRQLRDPEVLAGPGVLVHPACPVFLRAVWYQRDRCQLPMLDTCRIRPRKWQGVGEVALHDN